MKGKRRNEHQRVLFYVVLSAVYDLIALAADNIGYFVVRMAVQRIIAVNGRVIDRAGGMVLLRLIGGLEFLLKDHIQHPLNINSITDFHYNFKEDIYEQIKKNNRRNTRRRNGRKPYRLR